MAFSCNGTSEHVELANDADTDIGDSDVTFCFWYKSGTAGATNDNFFWKGTSSAGASGGIWYGGYISSSPSTVLFGVDGDASEGGKSTVPWTGASTPLADDVWHLWMFERDTVNNTLKIFTDGDNERVSGTDNTNNVDNSNTLTLMAGRRGGDTITGWMPGEMAEFAIIKRVLSGAEKDAMYTGGLSPAFYNPRVHCPLVRDVNNRMGPVTGSSGTTFDVHPRIISPSAQVIPFPPVAAAPVGGGVVAGSLSLMGVGI